MNHTPQPSSSTTSMTGNTIPTTSNPTPTADGTPVNRPDRLVIDTAEMTHLLAQGQAKYLSRIVHSFARHNDHWWLDNTTEWLRITDQDYTARLDRLADRKW